MYACRARMFSRNRFGIGWRVNVWYIFVFTVKIWYHFLSGEMDFEEDTFHSVGVFSNTPLFQYLKYLFCTD
jgi:hypothetical protein